MSVDPVCVRDVVFRYASVEQTSLDDVSLTVRAGECVVLCGASGCGKITLVRTLTGLIRPLSGRVLLDGVPAWPHDLMRAGFLVMQDVNHRLFSDSVRDELTLGMDQSDSELAGRRNGLLADLDLAAFADRHPLSLSGGQKQRVAIGAALMCGKRLIILDEPTSGLDRFHMEQVGALLRDTARRGAAVLVVTHDEELVAGWCDRVIPVHVSAPSGVPTASDRRSRSRHAETLGNRTRYARPYGCVLASR